MPGPNEVGLVAGVIVMGSKEKIPEILRAGNISTKMFGSQVNISSFYSDPPRIEISKGAEK
jgi:hypothetical protein